MNRRSFLVRATAFAFAGSCLRSAVLAQAPVRASDAPSGLPAPRLTEFFPLRRGVGYFTGRGGTIGWLSSSGALVAVDTQFPETASQFLAGLPGRGQRKLDVVFNTHHHGDHTGGNPIFKPACGMIVAQRKVPFFQLRAAERVGNLASQVFADTLFDDTWRHEFGDEIVTAQYFGPAHTGGDAVISFEKANVVHMGDLVFNRIYPVIDLPGGGSIRKWIGALETVARDYPADAIYLYGHANSKFGVSGSRGDLLVFRDYLSALLSHVEKGIAAGKTKAQIMTLENMPGFSDFHLPPGKGNRLPANLEAAYAELTAGPSA
ncbi:MAG: MBL fold metallo-hydrolase [Opitutaceae bacterium]|jgi:glyoxylase-like metal-dependent hydrolase (beta-lactamase superfamily II)